MIDDDWRGMGRSCTPSVIKTNKSSLCGTHIGRLNSVWLESLMAEKPQ